ncbi:MAG TPA: FtsX-like permease family protein, partial [Gemmatimonadaceae bacterium]|nr:FtsX-like permease family protein [Gemmatimonadaceae bacterium]
MSEPLAGRASLVTLLRLAWRESRTARRRLLLYMSSISLGVAALVAIDSFALNITRSVREQSRALVGGDIVFSARQGWTPAIDSLFTTFPGRGFTLTRVTTFASMAQVARTGNTRLTQVRAVGEAYPLYGEITTTPPGRWERLQQGRYVIADPSLLLALDARVGDTLALGYARFEVLGALASVPGDPGIAAAIGPRVFIPERYIDETRLLVMGSRADYDAFARVPSGNPRDIIEAMRPVLDSNQTRARTVAQQESAITEDIEDLSNFLGVVGIIALLLGGVGVASGVHAWVTRKIDTVAVLRCLGATTRQVMVIYVTQAAAMGLVGAAIGAALGVLIQFLLPGAVGDVLPVDVTVRLEPRAIAMGMLLGLWIAMAFALRPLLALRRVSPLQALRRNEDPLPLRHSWRDIPRLAVNLLVAASVVGLSATRAESADEVFAFSASVAGALVALTLSAAALSAAARRLLRRGWPYVLRQGVANLYRPGNQTRSVVLSLGFGAFLVTTLYLLQNSLLAQFRQAEFSARGNLVFFDVQKDQLAGVDSVVRAGGQEMLESVAIVTMRIASINGRSVEDLLRDSSRRGEAWSLRREYRSTYRDSLTDSERLIEGRWWSGDSMPVEISVEQELALDLGVGIGDEIVWDIQGVPLASRVRSIRTVDWARFEPNFFVVFAPGALEQAPHSIVTLARIEDPALRGRLQRVVAERFP